MSSNKQIMNEMYDALLITSFAVALSMASKKILREPLSTPETMKGTLKLAVAVTGGTLITKYLQEKKILPTDPFKEKP